MVLSPLRTLRDYAIRFMRLQGNPKSLAMGTAIGILIGTTPTVPLHSVGAIAITLLLRVNTVAALISSAIVCNPLTIVPLYYISWLVGGLVFPNRLTWERIKGVLDTITTDSFSVSMQTLGSLSFDAVLVMLTGGFVIGIPAAIAGYYYSLRFFIALNEKRRKKHLLN